MYNCIGIIAYLNGLFLINLRYKKEKYLNLLFCQKVICEVLQLSIAFSCGLCDVFPWELFVVN